MSDKTTVYYDLPQMLKLERQYRVKKYTFEDLDKFCKERYGDTNDPDVTVCYDAERDCCAVTFPKQNDKRKGPGFWVTFRR